MRHRDTLRRTGAARSMGFSILRDASMDIKPIDFDDPRVLALLSLHVQAMRGSSPPETVYVLDRAALDVPEVRFFAAWDGEDLLGFGALKALDDTSGEIKSMRTDPRHLRKGVGEAILKHLLALARSRGYRRVSLETGTSAEFDAALALYLRHGFRPGAPFADYAASPHNQFLHLMLRD
jgi:putative acetyltransferase